MTTRGQLAVGAFFVVFIWLAMDFVVLPLSRARPTPVWSSVFAMLLVWHAVGVGIPLALVVRGPAEAQAALRCWPDDVSVNRSSSVRSRERQPQQLG